MTVAAVQVASVVGFGTAVMLATAVVVVTAVEGVTVEEVTSSLLQLKFPSSFTILYSVDKPKPYCFTASSILNPGFFYARMISCLVL